MVIIMTGDLVSIKMSGVRPFCLWITRSTEPPIPEKLLTLYSRSIDARG